MFEDYPDVLTVEEVCYILRLQKCTVYKLIETNQIQGRKVGNKYLITKESIIDFLCNIIW